MSKPNYTKVEKALEEGMIKIKSQQLLNEADAVKGVVKDPSALPPQEVCTAVLTTIDRDLKQLHTKDKDLYKKLSFHKIDLKKLIADPSLLTPQDWQAVKEIRANIEKYKKELAARLPVESDESLIEHEKKKHINKRFKVSDKWLPLD